MGIRMLARVKREVQSINELLRTALSGVDDRRRRRTLKITPTHMGYKPELNYDNIESLVEYGAGEQHR